MKKKIIGYLVVSDAGVHSASCDDNCWCPTLWVGGSAATLFPTYQAARTCLARTRQHAQRLGRDWPWYEKAIIRAVKVL